MRRIDYNPIAAEYARHRRVHPVVLERLLAAVGAAPAGPVLDVGCGSGNYISATESATARPCFGIDPHEKMLDAARDRNRVVSFVSGRGERLPFGDEDFGLVFSVDVIHHVTSPLNFFREMRRVLKPGGIVCTVTESEGMIRQRIHSLYFLDVVAVESKRYPTLPALTEQMRQLTFADIREEAVAFSYQVTDIRPFRDKALSSLHYLRDDAFRQGIERMERDLEQGPIPAVMRAALLWGQK